MPTNVNVLRLTDPVASATYSFPLAPSKQGATGFALENLPWEPGDPMQRWRKPLHPFTGGLYTDRLYSNPRTYAKGNCDASYPGLLLFPPKVFSLTMANANTPVKQVVFDSKVFLVGGRYVYYYDPSADTVTEDEDLGSGVSAVDAAVFNNELIIACGESTKIFKRATNGTYTQASNNTFAIALGVVGSLLYRAESTNKISNCSTTPLTLANWTPASPNQYTVGDTTWAVTTIIDFGGIPWVGKGDGMYAPDPQTRFKNQTPEMAKSPIADNTKGCFVANGALWVPSSNGLYRIRPGKAEKRGPEVTFRPDYRFWVRGGAAFGDWIYLLVTDEAAVGGTFICKMGASDLNADLGNEYVYHEWARLDGTSKGYFIGVTAAGTNPRLVAGYGTTGLRYIKLGRGGGRDVDDSNYLFGTSMTVDTGPMMPGPDVTQLSTLVGVDAACDFSRTNDSLTMAYRYDPVLGSESYTSMLDTAEGSGSAAITTSGFTKATRYSAANTRGRFVDFRLTGTAALGGSADAAVSTNDTTLTDTRLALVVNSLTGVTVTCNSKTMVITSNTATVLTGSAWSGGSNPGNGNAWSTDVGGVGVIRPVIREAWAFGYSHPEMTDVISLAILSDDDARVNGMRTGVSRSEAERLFRDWANEGVELTMELDGYERGRTTRVLVRKAEIVSIDASPGKGMGGFSQSTRLQVRLARVDRANAYAD